MRGLVVSHRRGRHTVRPNQAIVAVEGVGSRAEAARLVGRKVVWRSPSGKRLVGVITAPHGNKGRVRVRFPRGLPGQAIGTPVEII